MRRMFADQFCGIPPHPRFFASPAFPAAVVFSGRLRHNKGMDYQVNLDTFRGPLDLLLYLVKRHEVDICDIPIARVTEQFLEYLNVIHEIDVERAGDFIVMAGTL